MYLTFDDGPIPAVTPWVLEQLEKFKAKATFFCVGDNIQKHRSIFQQVTAAGHSIGNHTFNHLNGWTSENIPYFHNVRHCARLVDSVLFRPPFGKMRPKQTQFLQRHYRIVMWDVLSGDFDPSISQKQCLENVLRKAGKGSIIVFHDSVKAWENLQFTLPKVLEYFAGQGYRFEALSERAVAEKPMASVA